MSRLLAKIMLALLMLPLAALVYAVVAFALDQMLGYSDVDAFVTAGVVTGVFVAFYWVALWLGTVRWRPERIVATVGAGVVALSAGAAVGLMLASESVDFGWFIGGFATILLWLTLTVFAWRETPSERSSRNRARSGVVLVCPRCGYNMTGLAEAACPECGARFTIDELVARQPAREQSEMEHEAE